MIYKETDDLYEFLTTTEDILDLEDDELERMMKDSPKEVITIIRHGYEILHTLLVQTLKEQYK